MTDEELKLNVERFPPGSAAAVMQGCTCAVWINRRGQGAYTVRYAGPPERIERNYWMSGDCPLHGKGEE